MADQTISNVLNQPQWRCLESKIEKSTLHYGRFIISPLWKGQANTIGLALRRTLLSEVEGTCITSVKIKNAIHEYSSLSGVQESVHDILINLKKIILSSSFSGIFEGFLSVVGPKTVLASDLNLPSFIKIINPNQYIATVNKPINFHLQIYIQKGKGYFFKNPISIKQGFF